MFKKILVPLDGSGVAENAIIPALDLAKKYNGTLVLLCTCATGIIRDAFEDQINNHNWFWTTRAEDPSYIEGEDYLKEILTEISGTGIEIQSVLVKGDEAGAIIGISEAQDINLIVMTKHCQSDPPYNLIGDITERVLHHASCPVMVICSNLLDGTIQNQGRKAGQIGNEPH
jgi:nucleotide-binding universal stress UspA family protein